MKASRIYRTLGTVLGLTVSIFLILHLVLLIFTNLTPEYNGSKIWIVIGIMAALACLLLLASDKKDGK